MITAVSAASNLQMSFYLTKVHNFLIFLDVSSEEIQEKEIIVGIVTDIDLLHHVAKIANRACSPGSSGESGTQTPNNELDEGK